ncbi:MAG: antitoxin [Acidimicrobiia bacterium]|nr:antitoxin [Acidimicrobiia bacterium]MYB73729.1 antitoxin [Acidimicrobiia bacterium]MYH98115.1 antitoxin [Acidimicrobiia bacterium]
MTMLSFRVPPEEAVRAKEAAEYMDIALSELYREALRRHINAILAKRDAEIYERMPVTEDELALSAVSYWLPADDWSDWIVDDDAEG